MCTKIGQVFENLKDENSNVYKKGPKFQCFEG